MIDSGLQPLARLEVRFYPKEPGSKEGDKMQIDLESPSTYTAVDLLAHALMVVAKETGEDPVKISLAALALVDDARESIKEEVHFSVPWKRGGGQP